MDISLNCTLFFKQPAHFEMGGELKLNPWRGHIQYFLKSENCWMTENICKLECMMELASHPEEKR